VMIPRVRQVRRPVMLGPSWRLRVIPAFGPLGGAVETLDAPANIGQHPLPTVGAINAQVAAGPNAQAIERFVGQYGFGIAPPGAIALIVGIRRIGALSPA